jgi:hypothetical protein
MRSPNLEAFPDMKGREGGELDGCARRVCALQRIDEAVNVVQWESVQDAVPRLPLPSHGQRRHLRCDAAPSVKDAFGAACTKGRGDRANG